MPRASRERAVQRELIRVLEAAARGQALRDARDGDGKGLEQFRDIVCRRIALHIRAEREDDFGKMCVLHACDQRRDAQIVRTDVIERRDAAAECVIASAEDARALQRQDVRRLFDDAESYGLRERFSLLILRPLILMMLG